jgi:hypothetical protein
MGGGMPGAMPGAMPGGGGSSGASGGAIGLTGHYSCPDYDVVQYTFTVIMPLRYVVALEENLLRQNYHTILKVDLAPLTGEANAAAGSVQVSYYYGSDALAQVTFRGEMLLLTSWQRGAPDTTAGATPGKWLVEPLIPADVLKSQLQGAPDALRDVDKARIK